MRKIREDLWISLYKKLSQIFEKRREICKNLVLKFAGGGGRLDSPKNLVFSPILTQKHNGSAFFVNTKNAPLSTQKNHSFNLQFFAEKDSTQKKKKYLPLVISLIIIIALAIASIPVISIVTKNDTKAFNSSTTTYVTVKEIWDSDAKKFITANLNQLISYLSPTGTISEIGVTGDTDATEIRGFTYNNKTSGQSVVVKLGGLEWQVVFLTKKSGSNERVATLLLKDRTTTSKWSSGWAYDGTAGYPSNMYGTSYIRAVTLNNGGQYATNYSTLSDEYSPVTTSTYARFTMSQYGLTKYLVQPKDIPYQNDTTQGGKYTGSSYTMSNEILGVGGSYSGYDYSEKTNYNEWGTDYIWLPSISETGFNTSYPGRWNLSTSERAISGSAYSWSRSSCESDSYCAYYLHYSGADCGNNFCVYESCAVRPALHLNLESAVLSTASNLTVSASSSNSSRGSVSLVGALSGNDFAKGSVARVTATPTTNNIFNYWLINGVTVLTNPYSFTVNANTTCVAYFKAGYSVTLNTNNSSYGRVYGAGSYESGTTVTLSAYPNTGYVFDYWEDSGGTKIYSQSLTLTVTSNLSYTAVFRASCGLVLSSTTQFSTMVRSDANYQTDYYITPTSGYYIYSVQVGSNPEQIMKNRSGILDYSDSAINIHYEVNQDGSRLKLSVVCPIENIAVTLVFTNTAPTLKNNANASGGPTGINVSSTYGGTAGVVGDNFDDLADDDTIIFYATPNRQGYKFEKWIDSDGNTLGTLASIRLTKQQAYDTKVTAVFVQNTTNTNSTTDTGDHDFV